MTYESIALEKSLSMQLTAIEEKLYIQSKTFTVLIANDDENIRFLIEEALQEIPFAINPYFFEDGVQLLDYLYHRGEYAQRNNLTPPHLILLDLHMPRLDGMEALKEIKSAPSLQHIPTVILTTSRQEEDISKCYDLGANSFIVRPLTFEGLVRVMANLCYYWFEIATLIPDE